HINRQCAHHHDCSHHARGFSFETFTCFLHNNISPLLFFRLFFESIKRRLSSFFHFSTSLRLNYLILVIPVFDFGSIIRIMVDLIFQYWGIAASARIEENFFLIKEAE
ncbi:MAG: hypothetical protein ACLTAC_31990, partial [Hungatella sp.]